MRHSNKAIKMKKVSLTEEVTKNSFHSVVATTIGKVGAVIFSIILARLMLPEKFGLYSLASSIILFSMLFIDLGINHTAIRYISKALGEKNIKKASAYMYYLLKIKTILLIIVTLGLIILAYPLAYYIFKKPQLVIPLLFSIFYIATVTLENFFESLFYALKKVEYIKLKEVIYQTLRIVLIILFFYFINSAYYVVGTFFILGFANLIILLLILKWINKLEPDLLKKKNSEIDKKGILSFLGYVSLGAISGVLFSQVDALVIGAFIDDVAYVGYYRLAITIVFSITAFLSFTNILIPIFTQIHQKNLETSLNKAFKYLMAITIPAAIGLAVLSNNVIHLAFGSDYMIAQYPLLFSSLLIVTNLGSAFFCAFISSRGKPQLYLKLTVYTAIIDTVLNFIFVIFFLRYSETHALVGAAVSTLISSFIFFIGTGVIIKNNFSIIIKKSNIIKPLLASLFMGAILLYIKAKKDNLGVVFSTFEVILGALIYFSAMYAIGGINKGDINLVKLLLKKQKHYKGNI